MSLASKREPWVGPVVAAAGDSFWIDLRRGPGIVQADSLKKAVWMQLRRFAYGIVFSLVVVSRAFALSSSALKSSR